MLCSRLCWHLLGQVKHTKKINIFVEGSNNVPYLYPKYGECITVSNIHFYKLITKNILMDSQSAVKIPPMDPGV